MYSLCAKFPSSLEGGNFLEIGINDNGKFAEGFLGDNNMDEYRNMEAQLCLGK